MLAGKVEEYLMSSYYRHVMNSHNFKFLLQSAVSKTAYVFMVLS